MAYAKVAIESPLPQLDRLFDYEIPSELAGTCMPGVRVLVPFGKGGNTQDAFVVEVSDTTQVEGQLNQIQQVISAVSVLPHSQYQLLRAIADRQAGTLSELTKLAVPKRSVRVEKAWLAAQEQAPTGANELSALTLEFRGRPQKYVGRQTLLAEPRHLDTHFSGRSVAETQNLSLQGWIAHFIAFALEQLGAGKSAILVVPDFRDQNRLLTSLGALGLQHLVASFNTEQTPSVRYAAYLKCLGKQPTIVIGSRAAIYAPVTNLGGIALWDDSDASLQEPTAPYLHTREIALLRQQQTECNLLLAGHSRTAEVQRLVELAYVEDATAPFAAPKLAVSEPGLRVDSMSYQAARAAFQAGGAVLVQVANTGHSSGTYCADCGTRSQCGTCHGPLFIDDKGQPRCRWCSAINLAVKCHSCGGQKLRQGTAGSTRTAAELGKSFPGVAVTEATWSHRVEQLKAGKRLVVATPGAEPVIDGGYAAVILLDGQRLLSKDTIRATEQAVAAWSNAISLLAPGGTAVGVGLASPLGQKLALWDQVGIAAQELEGRRELNFPPVFRLGTVTGPRQLVDQVVAQLAEIATKPGAIEVLGPLLLDAQPGKKPAPGLAALAEPNWRYLIRFEYGVGDKLAQELKARVLVVNAGNKAINANSGRASRAVRLKLDDSEVI